MTRFRLSRRTALRGLGLGSIAIGLPPLEAMFLDSGKLANAQETLAKKLVLFHFPTGIAEHRRYEDPPWFFPSTMGSSFELTDLLQPLAVYKSQINVLKGLTVSDLIVSSFPHGDAQVVFTCKPVVLNGDGYGAGASSISVDQVAANAIGGSTPRRSLVARLYDDDSSNAQWSWRGSQEPTGAVTDPLQLFQQLFGAGGNGGGSDAMAQDDRSILDYVKADLDALLPRLGAGDRSKLQQHLDSIREVERGLQQQGTVSCEAPLAPEVSASLLSDARANERSELLMQLVALGLRCDVSNVALYSLGGDGQHDHTFPWLSYVDPVDGKEKPLDQGNHFITHDLTENTDANGPGRDISKKIATWKISQFARFLELLGQSEAGLPSVLDQACVACTSETGEGNSHYKWDLPVIVAGKLGGMLGGRHLGYSCGSGQTFPNCRLANEQNTTPLANLWLTMLASVGAAQAGDTFGNSTGLLQDLWL